MKETMIIGGLILVGAALAWFSNPPADTGNKKGDKDSENVVTTNSGLKYVDVLIGTGKTAKAGDVVSVHYTGRLDDGKQFDSSVGRGVPLTFQLGKRKVIKGWDEGVEGMKEGGKRNLIIPSELGYGPDGAGDSIPPNATLHFEVELVKVK